MPNPQAEHESFVDVPSARLEFDTLLTVCRKLSELPLDELLDELLAQVRHLVHAEAGTLYRVIEGQRLAFACAQNDARPDLRVFARTDDDGALATNTIPMDNTSLAGYAAKNGQSLRIDDVHNLPRNVDYGFDDRYDGETGYRTVSMLVIPLLDQNDTPIGVLQLINRISYGQPTPFCVREERIATGLASMAAISVRNAILLDDIRSKNDELRLAQLDTVMRLANAAETRDNDTGHHIKRVSMYCEILTRRLGYSEDFAFLMLCASPMHDIGKLGIPDEILNKPGRLTPDERVIMETHAAAGARILQGSNNELMRTAERIAHTHHEKWDGTGYPRGLAAQDIPIEGRIAAVADVFDALTSRRCYKPPFSYEEAVSIIAEERGRHFDPRIVDAFLDAQDEIRLIHEMFGDTPMHPGPDA